MSTSDLSDSSHAAVGLGRQLLSERSCVACQNVPDAYSGLKILNCLHTMCVPCLKDNVNKDGTVSCFNCLQVGGSALPGIRLEESLVDWPKTERRLQTCSRSSNEISCSGEVLSSAERSATENLESSGEEAEVEEEPESSNEISETEVQAESTLCNETSEKNGQSESSNKLSDAEVQPMCQNPDCEGELVPAVSLCIDCGVHMCGDHEKLHSKRKAAAHGHRIVAAVSTHGGQTNLSAEFKCQLHPQHTVKSYCAKCKMLTCEQCCVRIHLNCSKDFQDIQTAAERMREEWKAGLSSCSDAWREKLSNTRSSIDTYTQDINDKVEELSETIIADFEEHIKNIRKRQRKVLDSLDVARWKALHRLEKQSEIVDTKSYQLDSCEHLVRNLGNHSLLAAEKILNSLIDNIVDENRKLSGKSDILPDTEYSLQVSYPGFADDESVHVSMLGELINSSNFGGAELRKRGGRAYPEVDTFTCDSTSLTVTDNGHEVSSNATDDEWIPIATLGSYCHGVVECTVQICRTRKGLFLGVAKETCRKIININKRDKKFLGWFSSDLNADFCVGDNSKLGQPWQARDIIIFRLDSNQHTLTGIHKRSGQSQTIPVPTGKLCFAADLLQSGIKFIR